MFLSHAQKETAVDMMTTTVVSGKGGLNSGMTSVDADAAATA